jgi:chemosensory pili system protein ChpB (putative protein-glutamate methylesterase)
MSSKAPEGALVGKSQAARRVCVLTGSMGSPAGLSRFFQSLKDYSLPVAFVVVIPISPDALPLLCDLIARHTRMRVLPALSGHMLRHGEIMVMPSDRLLLLNESGSINLVVPVNKLLNPIDVTMKALARHFGKNSGAIIFSGIGEDGQQGCCTIAEYGGEIWTQSEQSCHFDSMPRYVREACEVKYSSTPEKMALRLLRELTIVKPRSRNAVVGG